MIIAKQSFLLPFPSLLKKLRQLHSPPPPLIFQNEVLYTSQNNAAEARRYSMCNNKNTPLSVFCQATWLQRQQLKGERASSCCQCWAGWWGHSVAGDGEGAGHAAQGCPVPSGVWCRGTGTWRDADWKHTRSKQPQAMMCPQWEPWECCWQPVMRRYGRIGCLCRYDSQKNMWRRNRHYPKTNWSAEIWEMLLACQMNESKAGVLFIKFVYNKNLCSDEISTPTCCLVIVFMATLKAYIFCQMHAI